MRLIVIGTAGQRQAIRERLESSPPDIVAEFNSIADARVSGLAADALLLYPPAETVDDDEPLPERRLIKPHQFLQLLGRE